jgi:transcriptional antiterminator RfaH
MMGEGDTVKNWYVVSTHPHQEERAETNLRRQNFDAWVPKQLRQRRHARRVDTISAPLFPGYLFVSLSRQTQPWRAIDSTLGVRRIISFGEQPMPVERGFVEALKKTSDEHGVMQLSDPELELGQQLRLLTGPFSDCIGTLQRLPDKDRVAARGTIGISACRAAATSALL